MANLINMIPVYKPQPTANPVLPTAAVSSPFPQIQENGYLPAKPLSPARTTPKGAKPHAAAGYLVKENIFQSAGNTVKSYIDYIKYFYNAGFKGEGTDYSVGKINDLAIRTGSLGIAAVLSSSKMFPFAKGMEFVGLGTWFASMALWPRILGAPIKARTGVDINQKYVDSYGRRKFVYEDNQYRPMDIFRYADLNGKPLKPEEYYKKYKYDYVYLDAMGDKLNVPRNVNNRHEIIMNKSGQVAVQGRALSMLTAGIMTPVLSSIVADAAQQPLKNFIEKKRIQKESANMDSLNKKLEKLLDIKSPYGNRNIQTNLDSVMKELDIVIPEQAMNEFTSLLMKDCELSKAEFDRLKTYAQKNFEGTVFQQELSDALKSSVEKNGKLFLPKDKVRTLLESMNSEGMKNIDSAVRNELEYLLNRSIHLSKDEFDRLQKYLENKLFGTGFKESLDTVARFDLKYTEPHITLSDKLHEGLSNSAFDAIKETFKKLGIKEEDYPEPIKKYSGISREEFLEIIKRSLNDGAKEMNQAANTSFENVAKRVVAKSLYNLRELDEELIEHLVDIAENNVKKFMESQRHYIIPYKKLTDLFRFAEANHQILGKIEKYEAATIMNIAESATANNWGRLPQKYLEAFNFTKEEIAQLAALDSNYANKVVIKKFEQIVQNPDLYKQVIQKMSVLAQDAITKEEKAVLKLIGTAYEPGILSNVKDLMTAVGGSNFGHNMSHPISEFYRTSIFDVQNKLRNTIDSLIRPIKGLESFKYLDEAIIKILGRNEQEYSDLVYGHIDRHISPNPSYHMFEGLTYEQAQKSLKAYIKDIITDKNDINSWTTKFEHTLSGSSRGMKFSLEMVKNIMSIVYGKMREQTKKIITEHLKDNEGSEFVKKIDENSAVMNGRYISLDYKIAKDFRENKCFMIDYKPFEKLIDSLCQEKPNLENIHIVEALMNERKSEIPLEGISIIKKIINKAKGLAQNEVLTLDEIEKAKRIYLNFSTSNKAISEMSGKNISEFFIDAAQNIRSRNKWVKFVYSLLAGTVAVSGLTVALVGKENYFNKNPYKNKKKTKGPAKK